MAYMFASLYLSTLNTGNMALSRSMLFSKIGFSECLGQPELSLHCELELQNRDCEQ